VRGVGAARRTRCVTRSVMSGSGRAHQPSRRYGSRGGRNRGQTRGLGRISSSSPDER
jgi:hypothetical protein